MAEQRPLPSCGDCWYVFNFFVATMKLTSAIAGEIYFWRKDKSAAVHIVPPADDEEDKTVEVDCQTVGDGFILAVRSQDGVVRIWKAYEAQEPRSDTP